MPRLYIVATPIGNLGDFSQRAKETLQNCDLIAAEDTRVTRKLLAHFDIHTPLISNHRHNEEERAAFIVQTMMSQDLSVALVTDAGTPAISDPGSFLVAAAQKADIEVLSVPGPTAMAAALSVSGMDIREFAFYGFLPRKSGELREKLRFIQQSGIPIAVIHESPHRIIALMEAICEILPGCGVSVSWDLTKMYERTMRGTADAVLEQLRENDKTEKGEYCVVLDLHGMQSQEVSEKKLSPEIQILSLMLDGLTLKEAAKKLQSAGFRHSAVYQAKEKIHQFLIHAGEEEQI